jgi:hypothetical protein
VITFDDICAVVVTRGDVDLEPIVSTLPYGEIVVWDNSEKDREWRCYGRYLAVAETDKPVIYFQDDDLIFTAHQEILEQFRPDRMVVNMPSPWYEVAEYDKLGQALVGAGSLVPRGLPFPALRRYLSVYPCDELFLNYADVVVGMLTPFERVDLGYEVLDYASAPGRIWTTPGALDRKRTMQQRVMAMREAVAA